MPKNMMQRRTYSAPKRHSRRGWKPKRRSFGYNPIANQQAGSIITRKFTSSFSLVTNSTNMPNEIKFTIRW